MLNKQIPLKMPEDSVIGLPWNTEKWMVSGGRTTALKTEKVHPSATCSRRKVGIKMF